MVVKGSLLKMEEQLSLQYSLILKPILPSLLLPLVVVDRKWDNHNIIKFELGGAGEMDRRFREHTVVTRTGVLFL